MDLTESADTSGTEKIRYNRKVKSMSVESLIAEMRFGGG
jgi:hypothetical protein